MTETDQKLEPSIYAIIVAYYPDTDRLKRLCSSLRGQGIHVLVIDNSEPGELNKNFRHEECTIIAAGRNLGIAAAQNTGIEHALARGADILLFFDQDSRIDDGLPGKLCDPLLNNPLSITVPVSIDRLSGDEYPSRVLNRFGWPSNVFCRGKTTLTPVDISIASGTATTPEVFRKAGLFDESLFIDFVDVEWFLRCKRRGVQTFVVPEAVMDHHIGERTLDLGLIKITQHSPMRTYYKVRNSFLLLRRNIPVLFCIRQILPALLHNALLLCFVKNKKEYFLHYLQGICDGILGNSGEYPGFAP
jgi:rhamnosyltransferase